MGKADNAVKCFTDGFTCSQAVFSVWAEDLGLDKDTALRIASAFGAGMARSAETCGAVTGALMAVGLKHGRDQERNNQAKETTYGISGRFLTRFQEKNHALTCKALLGFDLSTPEGAKEAAQRGLFSKVCPNLVKDSVEILEEIL